MNSSRAGRAGEDAAASWLEAGGWRVVARNFRAGRGEIDLAAARGGVLAFFEVKAWEGLGPESLGFSIGPAKRRRIIETSQIFLDRHREYNGWRIRFDVLLLRGGQVREHYESAFTGEP